MRPDRAFRRGHVRRLAALAAVLAMLFLADGAPSDSGPTVRGRSGQAGDSITPAMIALGDSIFHGKVASALCATCHGRGAKGMPALGPDLTDQAWLHGDGSLSFLTTIIRTGVAKPKKGATPMPPFGGAPLNAEQLRAVAAFVHSLSRKRSGGAPPRGGAHPRHHCLAKLSVCLTS